MQLPILYSFRRCPYAMRARMAMNYSKISYEHREILLRKRPQALYDISAKGTVPVLQLPDGRVIDESIDIMRWALKKSDPESWYKDKIYEQDNMIERNDTVFKYWLDRYKYHVRYPENSFEEYQIQLEKFYLKKVLKLFKELTTLKKSVNVPKDIEDYKVKDINQTKLIKFSEKYRLNI